MLIAQWTSVAIAGVVFTFGVIAQSSGTPVTMTGIYAITAAICATQHVSGMIRYDGHWIAMSIEYLVYAVIISLLLGSSAVRQQLGIPQAA